jgi:hypothetical protein
MGICYSLNCGKENKKSKTYETTICQVRTDQRQEEITNAKQFGKLFYYHRKHHKS